MNIYFTASTSANGELKKNYQKIIFLLKKNGNELMSGRQIVDENLSEADRHLTSEQIFLRQKQLMEKSDLIIAEVSKPSSGVGGEIVYALTKNIPVLALIFENYDDKISPLVSGNPSENIFFENYNFEKLPYVIGDFIKHIKNLKKRKGVFIVIDGGDGSGKTTQARLLVNFLKKHKIPTKYVDFPQYYNSFHGKTVARFLRGEFGSINQVSPYLASLAYALDRASVKKEMEDFLSHGGYIIANRYATSNMAHQGSKFTDVKEREDYLKWVYELEYKIHKIPKENVVIYLYVPWQVGMKLTEKKGARDYLKGKLKDIHEQDLNHRIKTEQMYLLLAKKYPHWEKINCVENNKILPPETIQQKIIGVLKKKSFLGII